MVSPSLAIAEVGFQLIAYVVRGVSAYVPPGVYGLVTWVTG